MLNVTEPIRRAARIAPHDVALIRADDSTLTYEQFDAAIDAMARRAQALGLKAGDVVELAITGPDETLGIVMALALARLGIASADPGLPADRLRMRFDAGNTLALHDPTRLRIDQSWLTTQAGGDAPSIDADPDRICRIVGSSGTTGRPKFVPLTHAVFAQRVMGRVIAEGGAPDTRMIALGLGGGFGFSMKLRTFWMRGTLVLSNPARAAIALRRHAVNAIVASPHALAEILRALPEDAPPFPALRSIEAGGSQLPAAVAAQARARLCATIIVTMGSAEAGPFASAPIAALIERPGAAGVLWPGIRAEAVNDDGHALPPGAEGRLRIRSPAAAAGYFLPDADSREFFAQGWFQSNDIGAVWPDGTVTITGRASDLINSGGIKIAPERIERVFAALPGITDVVAFGFPDASGIERIWVALVAGTRLDIEALGARCERAIPAIAPEVIVQVDALPRNVNGKIDRDRLLALARQLDAGASAS